MAQAFTSQPKIVTNQGVSTSINLNAVLRKTPSSSIKRHDNIRVAAMAVNNEGYLLYATKKHLFLLGENKNEKLCIPRIDGNGISDMCWSTHLKRFLLLNPRNISSLLSLDVTGTTIGQPKLVLQYRQVMWSCTCYEETLLVSQGDKGSIVEEYNLSSWKLTKRFETPITCQQNEQIEKIRFNSDGNRLGLILREGDDPNFKHWFELRTRNDMHILEKINLGIDQWCWLISLPNEQFLASLWRSKIFFMIDSSGKCHETIDYCDNSKFLNSMVLIGDKYLVIQTWNPDELRFYDL
jgi:hypothetical protein